MNWFLVSLIYRFRPADLDLEDDQNCLGQENWHLLVAKDEEEAVRKSTEIANEHTKMELTLTDGVEGAFEWIGFGEISPIYDEIEDGCKVLWKDYQNESLSCLKPVIKAPRDG